MPRSSPSLHRRSLHWIALLTLLLQRSPLLLKARVVQQTLALSWGHVARCLPATAVTALSTHAVTGATGGSVEPVLPSASPTEIRMGEEFTWVFRTSGTNKAKSYLVSGLPTGVRYSGEINAGISSISGAPEESGTFTVAIIGWERRNRTGPATEVYNLELTVLPNADQGTFATWAASHELEGEHANPLADPDADGTNNLLEYAFNFDPTQPNAATGPIGDFAPISTPEILSQDDDFLQVAYIRRKSTSGADATYQLESSSDLENWAPVSSEEQTNDLDSNWEGVVTIIPTPVADTYLRVRVVKE